MTDDDWRAAERIARGVLAEHGGVAKLKTFIAAGLSGPQVAALRGRGVLERPRSGWYADPEVPWQGKHAVRAGGILSCVSACDSFGLPVPPGSHRSLHVLLQRNAPRVRHNRDRRRSVVPGEDREVVRHWSPVDGTPQGWRTDLLTTLVDLSRCVPVDWWIAAIDSAMHRSRDHPPMLSDDDLPRLREMLPPALREALALVDPAAESCLETLIRLGLVRRGIQVVSQFQVGRFRADLRVGERLLVEADGGAYHDEEKDRIRDAFLAAQGYRVLRFRYQEIVSDLESVLDRIEAALATL